MAAGPSSLAFFRRSLQSFLASQTSLRVLRTVSAAGSDASPRPSQLLVLDSSFNPPTRAHLGILSSAVASTPSDRPKRLVLLLATQNADKPAKPAAFEQRLQMMEALAEDLLDTLKASRPSDCLEVDIAVTKLPYFIGKAAALESTDNYAHGSIDGSPVEQVHLVGYDTLIRIFDSKYYPPDHKLTPLAGLFQNHRLRVTYRLDSSWGDSTEQARYLESLRNGERDSEGAERQWADRIALVPSPDDDDNAVSSTRAREAAEEGDEVGIRWICTPRVAEQVLSDNPYSEHA